MRLPSRPVLRDVVRTAGVAIAVFIVLNLGGEVVRGPFDTLPDWLRSPASPWLRRGIALVVAAALFAHAFVRHRPAWLRGAVVLAFGAVAMFASLDLVRFVAALARGRVDTPALVPASALVAGFFAVLAWEARSRGSLPAPGRWRGVRRLATLGAVVLALPLVRMGIFGPSRYERRADCAVVFGARVYDSGRPSMALSDRVDEAVRLYHAGLVGRIVMSGAIDEHNGFSEPVVMRDRAVAQGVPEEAVVLDEDGVDTAHSVRNTARIMREQGLSRALIVTHYYHEPRAKMLFDRAGIRAFTVPARMSRRLRKEPYFLLREVAAYYHSFLLQ